MHTTRKKRAMKQTAFTFPNGWGGARKGGGRKPARRDQPRGPAKAPRRDEYDKDSPFAALADLKDALKKREPAKPRAEKTGSGGSA